MISIVQCSCNLIQMHTVKLIFKYFSIWYILCRYRFIIVRLQKAGLSCLWNRSDFSHRYAEFDKNMTCNHFSWFVFAYLFFDFPPIVPSLSSSMSYTSSSYFFPPFFLFISSSVLFCVFLSFFLSASSSFFASPAFLHPHLILLCTDYDLLHWLSWLNRSMRSRNNPWLCFFITFFFFVITIGGSISVCWGTYLSKDHFFNT